MKKYTNPELEMIRISADVASVSLGGQVNLVDKSVTTPEESSSGGTKAYGGLGWNTNQ